MFAQIQKDNKKETEEDVEEGYRTEEKKKIKNLQFRQLLSDFDLVLALLSNTCETFFFFFFFFFSFLFFFFFVFLVFLFVF